MRSEQETYPIPSKQSDRKARSVALIEDGSIIMAGSNHGLIYLLNRRLGTYQTLPVAEPTEWVQSLEVSCC